MQNAHQHNAKRMMTSCSGKHGELQIWWTKAIPHVQQHSCARSVLPQIPWRHWKKISKALPTRSTAAATKAPAFEIQPEVVKKTIMSWPKGPAAGCSGLRAEHVKAVLSDFILAGVNVAAANNDSRQICVWTQMVRWNEVSNRRLPMPILRIGS